MGWSGRREAPIRCGYARTYVAGKWRDGFWHTPLGPGEKQHRSFPAAWQPNRRPPLNPKVGICLAIGRKGDAAQDVVLGDLDRIEAECAESFDQQHTASD